MKIVHVITRSDAPGGAQAHVRDLSAALLASGHEVTVLVGGSGPFLDQLRAERIPFRTLRHLVHPLRPGEDWAALREIRANLASLAPDIVATHSSKAGWLGRLAGRSLGIPTVFTAHGWAFTEGVPQPARHFYLLAEKGASLLSSRIITVSEYDRSLAIRLGVAPPGRLTVVYNGVPDIPRSLLADPAGQPVKLVMVARFSPPKDQGILIRSLAQLVDLDWSLDLVGEGEGRPQAEQLVRELGLQRRVSFLGERMDVAALLSQAQLLVLTTDWEGLPLSILEAMRAGLPVVASDVGGVREAVTDGETGFLVPRRDEISLSRTLRRLIREPELRAACGAAGHERYKARFTFQRMVESTLEVYRAVMPRTGVAE